MFLLPRYFYKNDFQKFLILSRSRSGSNFLQYLLASHPNIGMDGELFRHGELFSDLKDKNWKKVINDLYGPKPPNIKCVGFKIFYYHPLDTNSEELWKYIYNNTNIKILHLKRENIFHTLVSHKIANKTKMWKQKPHHSSQEKPTTIELTPKECEDAFIQTEAWINDAEYKFRDHNMLNITYKELQENKEATFEKIRDFLNIRKWPVHVKLKKQNPKKIRELVDNYDELKNAFANTKYASYFDE